MRRVAILYAVTPDTAVCGLQRRARRTRGPHGFDRLRELAGPLPGQAAEPLYHCPLLAGTVSRRNTIESAPLALHGVTTGADEPHGCYIPIAAAGALV